jgi:hypothetical protein
VITTYLHIDNDRPEMTTSLHIHNRQVKISKTDKRTDAFRSSQQIGEQMPPGLHNRKRTDASISPKQTRQQMPPHPNNIQENRCLNISTTDN